MLTTLPGASPTRLVLTVLLATVLAVVAAVPGLRRRDARTAARSAARVLLGGAVVAVLSVTLVGGHGGGGVNLVPGAGIADSLHDVNSSLGRFTVLGNVVVFTPVGLLLPLAADRRWRSTTLLAASLSLLVELAQLVLGRSVDVDDVLLNTCGAGLGALLGVHRQPLLQHRPASGPEVAGR